MNNWSFSSGMSKVRLNRCTFTYVMWLYIKKYLEFTRIIYVYAPCYCLFVVCACPRYAICSRFFIINFSFLERCVHDLEFTSARIVTSTTGYV